MKKTLFIIYSFFTIIFSSNAYTATIDVTSGQGFQSGPNYILQTSGLWPGMGPITDRYGTLYEKFTSTQGIVSNRSYNIGTQGLSFTAKPAGTYVYQKADICYIYLATYTECSTVTLNTIVYVQPAPAPIVVDQSRSIFIRDNATLSTTGITLGGVFQKLADQLNLVNPSDGVTAEQLFSRMWETQKQAPGNSAIPGPKCTGIVNGFQADCRNAEGAQSNNAAGQMAFYRLISLVNRFDLRDTVNFSNCGEYRMVFGRTDGQRNFIIFEAQLPNPGAGASGCAPIANFWASLSKITDANLRATNLAKFYIDGISASNNKPVVHIDNYAASTGQIRTNMFMNQPIWLLKEFKISRSGLNLIVPVSVKSNPFGELFSASRTDALAVNFRSSFLTNLSTMIKDRDTFFLNVSSDTFNNGESHANGDIAENNFSALTNTQFKANIQTRLTALGSPLTPDQIINRAEAMTCGGCHQPSSFGLTANNSIAPSISWPDTLGFVHVSELLGGDGNFPISPALNNVFIPARKKDFESYLNSTGSSSNSNSAAMQKTSAPTNTITGKRSG